MHYDNNGRLYRCDDNLGTVNGVIEPSSIVVNSSIDNTTNMRGHTLGGINGADEDDDDDGWEEREASRTHSVKFTDDLDQNGKEVRIYYYDHNDYNRNHFQRLFARIKSWLCCECLPDFDAYAILTTVTDVLD